MMYLIGGIAICGVALALYERRKSLRITYDDPQDPTQRSDRQMHDRAAEIRTQAQAENPTKIRF